MPTINADGSVESILNQPRTPREYETPEQAAKRRARFRSITEAARAAGELVFAFDQYDSELTTQPGPWGNTQRGFCWGMAADWLRRTTYTRDHVTGVLTELPWEATRLQVASHETPVPPALSAHHTAARDHAALAGAGLGVDAFWPGYGSPRAEALAEVFAEPSRPHGSALTVVDRYLYSMSGMWSGGHATAFRAAHHRGGQVVIHYLDSGYGCFRLPSLSRFTQWFAEFLTASRYGDLFERNNLSRVAPRHECPAQPGRWVTPNAARGRRG